MTAALTALALAGAFAVAFARLPLLHPLQIWFGSWAVAAISYAAHLLPFRPLSPATAAVILTTSAAFTAGALLGERAGTRIPFPTRRAHGAVAIGAALALATTAAGLALFLVQVTDRFGLRAALLVSSDVRHALVAGDGLEAYRFVHPAIAATLLCTLVASQSPARESKRLWLTLAALSAGSLYFSTGRQLVVLAVFAAIAIYGLPRAQRLRRLQWLGVAALLGLFAVVVVVAVGAIIGDKYSTNDLATFENPFSGGSAQRELGSVYLNASAPVAALNEQVAVSAPWGRAYGCATLPLMCGGLDALGLDVEREPRVRPFTDAPVPWNTYTFLDAPLIDFGPYLAPLAVGVLGLLIGAAWMLARRGTLEGIVAYAMAAAMLAFAGRQSLIAQALQWAGLAVALMWTGAVLARVRAPLRSEKPWARV